MERKKEGASVREQRPGGPTRAPSHSASMAAQLGCPETTTCPFCGGTDTELHSPFGSALSVATYWCLKCRTAFEWIKWG